MNRLTLNKELYTFEHIERTRMAFAQLSEIDYEESETYHILSFKKCIYDIQITKKEFENYVINLMVSKNGK